MMVADNYDTNHFSVSWEGTSANTFVHLWSTIDRLRNTIDLKTSFWLLGTKGPTGYAEHTGMSGAADTYLYPREMITLPYIGVLARELNQCVSTDLTEDFESFYEFRKSLMLPKEAVTIDVSTMMMRNLEIAESTAKLLKQTSEAAIYCACLDISWMSVLALCRFLLSNNSMSFISATILLTSITSPSSLSLYLT